MTLLREMPNWNLSVADGIHIGIHLKACIDGTGSNYHHHYYHYCTMLHRLVSQFRLARAAEAAKAIKPRSIPKPLQSPNPITFPQKAVVVGLHAIFRGFPLLAGYLYILEITSVSQSKDEDKDDKQSTKSIPGSGAGFKPRIIQRLSFYSSGDVFSTHGSQYFTTASSVPPSRYLAFLEKQR
ncbi:predicted protein [Lichtheimia corymbifera JMRC:FSU:9682]|uniref:Uncharacterized protein n=1 Tax=Lichtheimia corymbifera JMRC:FSU:9682 TaxID=1263082 RepID=A0A068SAN5_9FUNG|nr:predicted protein [Lichtheimia corymbifera JMRC:FSU:9682]